MIIFLFLLNGVCYAGQSAAGKLFAAKGGKASDFNLCKAASAATVFLVWVFVRGSFHWNTLPLAALYGVCLSISMYCGFQALSCGPMALTSILVAMSLLIPYGWGLLFWQEPCTTQSLIGISILLASMFLIHYRKQTGYSAKWLLYSLLTMITNGFCSVIQKYHQLSYPGSYQQDFMLVAMVIVTLVCLIRILLTRSAAFLFSGLGVCSGVLNGLANFIILLLAASQDASKLFPLIGAENVFAAWLAGIIIFRERIAKQQLAGLALGILGLILFNL